LKKFSSLQTHKIEIKKIANLKSLSARLCEQKATATTLSQAKGDIASDADPLIDVIGDLDIDESAQRIAVSPSRIYI
jgi:hypothetical protein